MEWIILVLAFIILFFFLSAFDTSIMVIRTSWKWQHKVKAILFIWLIPGYGIYLVRSRINEKREFDDEDESDDSGGLPSGIFDDADFDSDTDYD
jgi:hypothetical protein